VVHGDEVQEEEVIEFALFVAFLAALIWACQGEPL
jgi:hypothetical protein